VTDETHHEDAEAKDQAEALAMLAAMFAGDGGTGLDQIAEPLLWPSVTAADAAQKWAELRSWVEELTLRFAHLDHHVIPLCWWRHNEHVEALVALRDHERMCYANTSPPSAAVEWHRAFRDIEARLREWTSTLPCGSDHDPRPRPTRTIDEDEWTEFVAEDVAGRTTRQKPAAEASTDASSGDRDTPAVESEQDR
jgi:hypothetical protein